DVVAFFIIVACAATIYPTGHTEIRSGADAALALRPLAGRAAGALFAFGLCNASLFAASILPLATAYYVCEALGLESGVNKRLHEAPTFYTLYTGLIGVSALAVILLPARHQFPVIVLSQVLNGALRGVLTFGVSGKNPQPFRSPVKTELGEAQLLAQIDLDRLPQHIAMIMDGNGRWAKRRRLPRIAGHRAGIRAVRQAVEACAR